MKLFKYLYKSIFVKYKYWDDDNNLKLPKFLNIYSDKNISLQLKVRFIFIMYIVLIIATSFILIYSIYGQMSMLGVGKSNFSIIYIEVFSILLFGFCLRPQFLD